MLRNDYRRVPTDYTVSVTRTMIRIRRDQMNLMCLLKMEKFSVNLLFQTDSGHYRNSFSVPASHLPADIRWWLVVTGDDMLTSPVTSGVGQCWGPAEETDLRGRHGATPAIRGVRNDARTPATRLPDIRRPGWVNFTSSNLIQWMTRKTG